MEKRKLSLLLGFILLCSLFFGCNVKTFAQNKQYKGRVFYEVFVRAFNSSKGESIGDIKGVTQKLDYLKNMGIKGIWLMPINESPSYHGYDVTDYYKINPDYGTMEDFKELIKEAHKKDIMVVMDLVINHTSIENQWFKEASKDKNSKYRNYYIWADSSTKVDETSPMGTKPWTQLGQDYYYSIFWQGMPDLNYDNKDVREEMKKVAKFYLDMGVDGFRLDAAKWIYNDNDKNVEWWKEFNSYVKSVNKNAVLVGEVWDNTDTIAEYMKGLDSAFNFPLSDSIVNDVNDGSMGMLAKQIGDIYDTYAQANKEYKDSPFLTNHDGNRVMSKLNDVEKAKKAAAIYLTLPGTPFVYYGEETGMEGTKPDEKIREPFIWDNKDKTKNTSWEPVTNDLDKIAVSVQEKDKNSLLNFYKQIINLRNNSDVLREGNYEAVATDNDSVLGFKRILNKKEVYVYVNTSKDGVKEKIDLKKAKIMYSNNRQDKSIKFNGTVELKGDEILILEK